MRNPASKIKTLRQLETIIGEERSLGKKIVLGHGIFDFLHYGHIHYLRQAKELGDVLVVSIVADKFVDKGIERPVFKEGVRANFLSALECVDYIVFGNDIGPWDIMAEIKPDIYAKGEDSKHRLEDPDSGLNKDKKIIESVGGILCFTKSLPIHSTELLKNHSQSFSSKIQSLLASLKSD